LAAVEDFLAVARAGAERDALRAFAVLVAGLLDERFAAMSVRPPWRM
jgi:hypothetical protein